MACLVLMTAINVQKTFTQNSSALILPSLMGRPVPMAFTVMGGIFAQKEAASLPAVSLAPRGRSAMKTLMAASVEATLIHFINGDSYLKAIPFYQMMAKTMDEIQAQAEMILGRCSDFLIYAEAQ
jgi:hypothetical protein